MGDDSESHHQLRSCGLLIGLALAFLLSAWFAWREFRFSVSGRIIEASVTGKGIATKSRRGLGRLLGDRQVLVVTYGFTTSDGASHIGSQDLPADFVLPETGKVPVVYLPSRPEVSKMQGHGSTGAVVFFLVCTALMIGGAINVWRQAGQDVQRSRRK